MYQDELQAFLLDAYDIDIRQSTVSKVLKKINTIRKKLKVEAA